MLKKVTFFLVYFLCVGFLQAQNSGDLDISFGQNGKVLKDFGQADFSVRSQITQTDGKIVIAGVVLMHDNSYGYLMRINGDGSLDTSFNGTGLVINRDVTGFYKVVTQPDGKLLIAASVGEYATIFRILRYLPNGTLDNSFGQGGTVGPILEQGAGQYYIDLALQSDGKIILLSRLDNIFNGGPENFPILTRYKSDGEVDNTFGTNGATTLAIGTYCDAQNVLVLNDDKIVISGTTNINSFQRYFIAKFTASGIFDLTFNSTGWRSYVLTGYNGNSLMKLSNLVVQSDGKFLFVIETLVDNCPTLLLYRVTAQGNLDTSFSGDGVASEITLNADYEGRSILRILPNGTYLIAMRMFVNFGTGTYRQVYLYNFLPNGSTNIDFGSQYNGNTHCYTGDLHARLGGLSMNNDGTIAITGNTDISQDKESIFLIKVETNGWQTFVNSEEEVLEYLHPFPAYNQIVASKLQPDGKIVVGGNAFSNNQLRPIVARFNSDGSLDSSFGVGGFRILRSYGSFCYLKDIEITPSGKILVASGNEGSFVAQLNANGSIDNSFGNGGYKTFDADDFKIMKIELLNDGKILLAGSGISNIGGTLSRNYKLIKLNANGTSDSTFGINGNSTVGSTTNDNEVLHDVKALPSGKIIAAGTIQNQERQNVALFHYNADGTLDTESFNSGITTIPFDGTQIPHRLIISGTNKIILSYTTLTIQTDSWSYSPVIARFFANGELDTSFGGDGIVEFSEQTISRPKDLYEDNNGKLLIAGTTFFPVEYSTNNFTVIRVNTDGSLDDSFADNGKLILDFNNKADVINSLIVSGNTAIACGSSVFTENSNDFSMAKFYLNSPLSTAEFDKAKKSFYPNPASQFITLDDTVLGAEIFTIDGKHIPTKYHGNRLDTNSLPNGIYLLHLKFEGNHKEVEKLVVKH